MEILKHYLRDHLRSLAALLLAMGVSAFLFFLYDLSFSAFWYLWTILLTLFLLLFLIPGLISYGKKISLIRRLNASLTGILEFPQIPGTLPEQELGKVIGTLCDEIRRLNTDSFSKQQDMLEYYTLWVHQIKTPLAAMRLILQANPGETDEALLQELFKVERYVEMVLGYLRLDTIGSDLRLEKYDIYEIVRQAVKKFAPLFIYRKLTLTLEKFHCEAVTDEKWLCFVLEQLLSNAVKYTQTGNVTIFIEEPEVLVIRDTGTGIAPEDLPRIFERGFTGINGRMDKNASGLGLYLTKQILDKLNIPIQITSVPEEGTEVRLFFHRQRAAGGKS